MDLADGLFARGIRAAFNKYVQAAASINLWDGGSYSGIVSPFLLAGQAQLVDPLPAVAVCMYGVNGTGSADDFATMQTRISAALRADFGATMGIVIVRVPQTYVVGHAPMSAMVASQEAYVASDANSLLARYDDATFYDGTHPDAASGRRLAVGPDVPGVVKSVLTCIEEFI